MSEATPEAAPGSRVRDPRRVRTVGDRVLGFVGGAMIVAALLLLVFGGEGDGGAAAAVPAPALELRWPASDEVVEGPLELRFASETRLVPMRGGWGAGDLHLHAELDGREYMPGPADIRRLPDGSYSWMLGRVQPGSVTLRLFWSDAAHRPLDAGATPLISVRIE